MNIVHHSSRFLPAVQMQQGLGLRLFGINLGSPGSWLKKGLKMAVSYVGSALTMALPFAGEIIGKGVEAMHQEIDSWNFKAKGGTSQELTTAEETKLNKWLEIFKTYTQALVNEAAAAAKLPPEAQIAALNAVLNKINIIQDHYAATSEIGLSTRAIEQRNVVIYQSLKLIHDSVLLCIKKLQNQGHTITAVTATVQANAYNFTPLFSSTIVTTVTGENYTFNNKLPAGTTTTTPTKPGGTSVIKTDKGDLVINQTPVLLPGQPSTGSPATTTKSNNTKVIVGVVAGAAAIYAISQMVKPGKSRTLKKPAAKKSAAKKKK